MYASSRHHSHSNTEVFREFAAASGATLFICWLGGLIVEAIRFDAVVPNIHSFPQALVLAVVFTSYAIGWRHKLAGGVLAIMGTAAFFLVSYLSVQVMPPLPAAWFAVPGVLYLLAWAFERKHPQVQ
jgi:hypothetical protein